ncbi:hypothetical protein W02_32120 [Nitrospira sp. KM1]|uniref:hypothetical protein n=1 Tax=Nitrospira sp. KM1 TaxID=1936990 RepID=UPI0013A7245A|nr:hypothetical protein [Nitrospira sp. KM1]BCA56072.1 hypothetical protein W02_32120 [Nitrospira sp. KM1]
MNRRAFLVKSLFVLGYVSWPLLFTGKATAKCNKIRFVSPMQTLVLQACSKGALGTKKPDDDPEERCWTYSEWICGKNSACTVKDLTFGLVKAKPGAPGTFLLNFDYKTERYRSEAPGSRWVFKALDKDEKMVFEWQYPTPIMFICNREEHYSDRVECPANVAGLLHTIKTVHLTTTELGWRYDSCDTAAC